MKYQLGFPICLNTSLKPRRVLKGLFYFLPCLLLNVTVAQHLRVNGPSGSGSFGSEITVLTNGNYVVADPNFDNGGITDVGAVYLYNGFTHALISTVTGSQANDMVGNGGVEALTNGNFVISSEFWANGSATKAGAVTWVNGTTGLNGTVNQLNSLVGRSLDDQIGNQIFVLQNGNYITTSPHWDNTSYSAPDAGAATWGNGQTGTVGRVSESNSLVGDQANDVVGLNILMLKNGNYVVMSSYWRSTSDEPNRPSLGAVTWEMEQ